MHNFLFISFNYMNEAYSSTSTRKAARSTIRSFHNFLTMNKWTINSPTSIKIWHLEAYVAYLKRLKQCPGTQKNKLSHLRKLMEVSGRRGFARGQCISNQSLSIEKRSRIGTKSPVTYDEMFEFIDLNDTPEWAELCMLLSYYCGTRAAETICQTASTYSEWSRSIMSDCQIKITKHSKGGRPRVAIVLPHHRVVASIVCQRISDLAFANGGFIAQYHNGLPVPKKHLALSRYATLTSAKGLQPHRLRYTYAENLTIYQLDRSVKMYDALIVVSASLGHGPSRARWVKSVYCRSLINSGKKLEQYLCAETRSSGRTNSSIPMQIA